MRVLLIIIILQISIFGILNADGLIFDSVVGTNVNLRAEPDIKSKVLTTLPIDNTVSNKENKIVKAKIGNIDGNWIFVTTSKIYMIQGKDVPYKGWIFDYYLYKWGTPIGSKGFERVKKILLEKNTLELIQFEDPRQYNVTINENGTFEVIINGDGLINEKVKGQIYRYRSKYMCDTKNIGFSFYIDDERYLRIINSSGTESKPSKIKVREEPVVELIK